MGFISDDVLDAGLAEITTNGDKVVICSSEPTTYTEANSTYKLGEKTSGISFTGPANGTPDGRKVSLDSFTDGNVTATGTATHYALLDTTGSRLLAVGDLSSSIAVTNGALFGFSTDTDITLRDAL